jgi:hypothetical protein
MNRFGFSAFKATLIILLPFVMTAALLLPVISGALHQCAKHSSTLSETTSLQEHSERGTNHESHDCGCPTHRVDCCHYQVTLQVAKLNLFSIYFENTYLQKHLVPPSSPALDGPFQPPRV